MFNKVCLVGVGLINASLAKDLKRLRLANTIVGIGRDPQRLKQAQSLEIIDEYLLLQDCNVADADLVVLGVPVQKMREAFVSLKSTLSSDTVLTDVGSTKSSILDDAERVFGEVPSKYVPAHPIAGSEQSGFEHAQENLFKDRKVILTPTNETDRVAVEAIIKMWMSVGAKVDEMTATQHDAILSATSHLPHIVAYTLVNYLGERPEANSIFAYAAGGFKDFTRIASSDPAMWADICIANQEKLLQSIEGFRDCLEKLYTAIKRQDEEAIYNLFKQAKCLRDEKLLKS